MFSARGSSGVIIRRSSTELFPELSSPTTTICGGCHPSSVAARSPRRRPSSSANIRPSSAIDLTASEPPRQAARPVAADPALRRRALASLPAQRAPPCA